MFFVRLFVEVRTRPRTMVSLTGSRDLQMVNISLRTLVRSGKGGIATQKWQMGCPKGPANRIKRLEKKNNRWKGGKRKVYPILEKRGSRKHESGKEAQQEERGGERKVDPILEKRGSRKHSIF